MMTNSSDSFEHIDHGFRVGLLSSTGNSFPVNSYSTQTFDQPTQWTYHNFFFDRKPDRDIHQKKRCPGIQRSQLLVWGMAISTAFFRSCGQPIFNDQPLTQNTILDKNFIMIPLFFLFEGKFRYFGVFHNIFNCCLITGFERFLWPF
jgi:hypothetical protein